MNDHPNDDNDLEEVVMAEVEPAAESVKPEITKRLYFKPAGQISIDFGLMRAEVSIDVSELASAANEKHNLDTAYVFLVLVGEDGKEHRSIRPLSEGFLPIRADRPGTYQALGLILTPEQVREANGFFFKPSAETDSGYEYTIVDYTEGLEDLKIQGYDMLKRAVQLNVSGYVMSDDHVSSVKKTWFNRMTSLSFFWSGPPKTMLSHRLRQAFAPLQVPLSLAWMVVKGAVVAIKGLYAFCCGARGFDWGAIFDSDMSRSKKAGENCVVYSWADADAAGRQHAKWEYRRELVPINWWKGIVLGMAVACIFFDATVLSMISCSVFFVFANAFLQLRTNDNDGQLVSVWRFLLNGAGGLVRTVQQASKIPFSGLLSKDQKMQIVSFRAKCLRPVVVTEDVSEGNSGRERLLYLKSVAKSGVSVICKSMGRRYRRVKKYIDVNYR